MPASKRRFFYKNLTINAASFPDEAQMKFGFEATRVIIINDSKNTAKFSFLKPHLDGELFDSDGPIAFDGLAEGRLWFSAPAEGKPIKVRVWAWGKG